MIFSGSADSCAKAQVQMLCGLPAAKGSKIRMMPGLLGVDLGCGMTCEDWNFSAPHGAGRILRRDEARQQYTVAAFRKEMAGVYCSCIGEDTLDEAPFAYRAMEEIKDAVADSVIVTAVFSDFADVGRLSCPQFPDIFGISGCREIQQTSIARILPTIVKSHLVGRIKPESRSKISRRCSKSIFSGKSVHKGGTRHAQDL